MQADGADNRRLSGHRCPRKKREKLLVSGKSVRSYEVVGNNSREKHGFQNINSSRQEEEEQSLANVLEKDNRTNNNT